MMSNRAIGIGAILLGMAILFALLYLLGLLTAILLILGLVVFAAIVVGLILVALILVLAAPYYLLKKPATISPESSATLDQIREP